MKVLIHIHKHHAPVSHGGFALIATLMLMILLMIISVGLLSLSTVTLRSSNQNSAQAQAQANARMALMIAIGELQKYAGPDRAITATSEILTTPSTTVAKPNTTGVWESWWDFDPSTAPNYSTEKTKRFKRWLVSGDDAAASSLSFATSPWTGDTIELVGDGTLGISTTDDKKVIAGLVPVAVGGEVQGGYAWHVADESVKARVNLYRDPSQNTTLAQKRALLAGQRPDPSVIKQTDGSLLSVFPTDLDASKYTEAYASTGKIIDLNQAELLTSARGKIKPLRHDITPYSLGVMTDVRGGGLKQDLSSVFEMGSASANTLPTEFSGKKLYASTHGITGVSDPNWSSLAGYYNSFRSLTNPETSPTFTVKQAGISLAAVPDGFNPAPVIAKVDTIISTVARQCTDTHWLDATYDYYLDLVVTPVVTLHNPYNVSIQFQKMQVSFTNIPIGFRFMFQDSGSGPFVSQSVEPGNFESINTMFGGRTNRKDKTYTMTIANWADTSPIATSSGVTGPVIMKPGQTLICGPVLPPTASLKTDSKLGSNTLGYDWENNSLTSNIKAQTSFVPGLGFETAGVTISHTRRSPAGLPGGAGSWCSFFMLREQNYKAPAVKNPASTTTATDRFYIEYKIQRPYWYANWDSTNPSTQKTDAAASFAVRAQLQATPSDSLVDYANLQFDYSSDATIKNLFSDRVYRYPPTGSYSAYDVAALGGVTYSAQSSYVFPIGIFSAYSRTTNGGVYETGKRTKSPITSPQVDLLKDGRLAGKPYLFHNPASANFTANLATQKPSAQAYELNFQPFLSKGDFEDYLNVDLNNRVPALSGNKTTAGIKSGSYLEIPSGPLQTIADFRRSNAFTTAYPPHFVQPVGNSLLHPLMSATKVVQTSASASAFPLLDHSVLANHALYDRFYFSSFATRGSETPDVVFENFMNGTAPLASQAFQSYLTPGKTVATAKADLFTSSKPKDTAYKTAAEYQLIRGPFNVNSTSVQAWKAVLASMNKSEVNTLWARTAALESKAASGVAFPAMSLVNAGSSSSAIDSSKIDDSKTNTWNGYREITEPQLETLATKIVAEVRARGPFLSMSEFVNRRIGPAGPLTLTGALEAAIAKAEINEPLNATSANSFLNQVPIAPINVADLKLYGYNTIQATTGNPAAGAPGWVSQADLLRILEPAATVRGDTFVIRTYGEALDAKGKVTAKAYAEAVVQRFPDYVDISDRPSLNATTDPTAKAVNKLFGRRFEIVSFRWLSNNEI